MAYRLCRWYDTYPKLAYLLRLVKLMPLQKQTFVGAQLNDYLAYRNILSQVLHGNNATGGRWYDDVDSLVESLGRLKSAPDSVKHQSTDFLMQLIDTIETTTMPHCA